jgi:kynurenine 3-monooxygenase
MKSDEDIIIIGGGLAGPLLAIGLAARGFNVKVIERRLDLRSSVGSGRSRSINLAVSVRGIHALQEAGLWKPICNASVPMKGRMMHSAKGELSFQPYGNAETQVIYSISRSELNIALINEAEARGVEIQFGTLCTGIDFASGELMVQTEDDGSERCIRGGMIFGTDGAGSVIRHEMLKTGRFDFCQRYLDYGYKQLTIPCGREGKHLLEPNALHIWPRGKHMLIGLPAANGIFGCVLFLPLYGPASFAELADEPTFLEFFSTQFPDAAPLLKDLSHEYFSNPTGSMVTLKCRPWHVSDKALLLGDAAHAMAPFFGQGMNCAFEDCSCLLEAIDRHGFEWEHVIAEFEQNRITNTDAISDLALDNFVEMRDLVARPSFLFRKKVELALERRHPNLFIPKYSMVTFLRIPYSLAQSRGALQDQLLGDLCQSCTRLDEINWTKADELVRSQLTPL